MSPIFAISVSTQVLLIFLTITSWNSLPLTGPYHSYYPTTILPFVTVPPRTRESLRAYCLLLDEVLLIYYEEEFAL